MASPRVLGANKGGGQQFRQIMSEKPREGTAGVVNGTKPPAVTAPTVLYQGCGGLAFSSNSMLLPTHRGKSSTVIRIWLPDWGSSVM